MSRSTINAVDSGSYIAKTADDSRGDVIVNSGWNESPEDLRLFNGNVKSDSENYLM